MRIPKIQENLNYVSLKIRMKYEDTNLAVGTAFFYLHNGNTHLITTWHNVTGKNPTTQETLSDFGSIPDNIVLGIPRVTNPGQSPILLKWEWKILKLYEDDEKKVPIWYEHPNHHEKIDIVTIPLSELEDTALRAANDQSLDLDKIKLYPSIDVYILGFPRGMSGGAHFPIWKRGSIATEPDIDIDNLPKIYIDTATREGMSGSPVYAQEVGYWLPEGATTNSEAVIGKGRRFLGIYSGRVGDDSFLAQLGIVWKERAIIEIIEGECRGNSSFKIEV